MTLLPLNLVRSLPQGSPCSPLNPSRRCYACSHKRLVRTWRAYFVSLCGMVGFGLGKKYPSHSATLLKSREESSKKAAGRRRGTSGNHLRRAIAASQATPGQHRRLCPANKFLRAHYLLVFRVSAAYLKSLCHSRPVRKTLCKVCL